MWRVAKGRTLIVHDTFMIARVAARLEECCSKIEFCRQILSLPAEGQGVTKEYARKRLESAQQSLADLLKDIEDGILEQDLKRIYNEYCGGGNDGEV